MRWTSTCVSNERSRARARAGVRRGCHRGYRRGRSNPKVNRRRERVETELDASYDGDERDEYDAFDLRPAIAALRRHDGRRALCRRKLSVELEFARRRRRGRGPRMVG